MKKIFISAFYIFVHFTSNGQTFEFRPMQKTPMVIYNSDTLTRAWEGGYGAPQFQEMDLDFDGIEDLVVFDRVDKSVNTYLKVKTGNRYEYQHAPQYQGRFPYMYDWMILADYNNDGKKDIFTSGNGAIRLFKNVAQFKYPDFKLESAIIIADYGFSFKTNIYVLNSDIPAIADFDNDGDLDIAAFDLFYAGQMFYFKNQSMEKYNKPDSIDYLLTTQCWGRVFESSLGNKIITGLNSSCKIDSLAGPGGIEHAGSSITVLDYNHDGKKDLLIGDISFNNLKLLLNTTGGIDSIARIDTLFPTNANAVNIHVFPAGFMVDVNNDGKKDFIASTNDPNFGDKNKQIWYYENTGTATQDQFTQRSSNYLLDETIDFGLQNVPSFVDYDRDGDLDLVIATENHEQKGILKLYLNNGTSIAPSYELVDTNFLDLVQYNLERVVPAFGDLTQNGVDLIIGSGSGDLLLFENATTTGNSDFVNTSTQFQNVNFGAYAAPELVDLDRDGLLDMVIGNRDGKLRFYKNTGTIFNPIFSGTPTINDFGKIRINEYSTGFAVPRVSDLNQNGNYDLVVGTEKGKLYFYADFEPSLTDSFPVVLNNFYEEVTGAITDYNLGILTAPAIAQLTNDTFPDIAIGFYKGGIQLFQNHQLSVGLAPVNLDNSWQLYPNPNNGSFIVTLNEASSQNTSLKIYNAQAQLVYNTRLVAGQKTFYLSTQDLQDGMYFIELSEANQAPRRKKIAILK